MTTMDGVVRVDAVRDVREHWTGCWCGPQMHPAHDPRERDCPQHGSDDCRHMAEGFVLDLDELLGQAVQFEDALCDALIAARYGKYDGKTVETHLEHLIERVRQHAEVADD